MSRALRQMTPDRERELRAFLTDLGASAASPADSYAHRLATLSAQMSAEAYRWARVDRRTQHFQPPHRSGDAAIAESWPMMTARVRSEVLNNAQFKHAVEVLTDLIVGDGMKTYANPIDPGDELSADLDDELAFALESDALFEEWANDPEQCDVGGKLSFYEMQRLAFSENVQSGDSLLVRSQVDRPGRLVPLAYQLVEREQLDTSVDRPARPGQNRIVNGIELDEYGREVAFYIYDAHPYDDFQAFSAGTQTSTRVPASRVLHLFMFHRPSQSVGVTWLHALGQTSFDRDKFLGAELQTAAKVALLAVVAKLKGDRANRNFGLDDGSDASDDFGNEEIVLGSSPLAATIGDGEEVEVVESNRPNPDANAFFDLIDHDAAGAAGLSYYRFTGRYDKTSYSSARAAHLDDEAHVRPIQGWLGRRLVLPVRRAFQTQAAAAGLFSNVTPAEFRRQQRKFLRCEAIGTGREQLDPQLETEAAIAKLRAGLSTLKIECGKRGLHWIQVLRQIALENRVAKQLGVTLDHSKGQGSRAGGSTRDASAADSDEAPSPTRRAG